MFNLFTLKQAPLVPGQQLSPNVGVCVLLDPVYSHAADNLLLPRSVVQQYAIPQYLMRNRSGCGVLVNDFVEQHATIVRINGAVAPLFQVL